MKGIISRLLLLMVALLMPSSNNNEDFNPGNPQNAVYGMEIEHKAYTVSFNSRYHIANWVAWNLRGEHLDGSCARCDCFAIDPDVRLTDVCPRPSDYSYSGYDRGHMCPSEDNTWDQDAMRECFYMSNMIPQTNILNGGCWKRLENKCRDWARTFGSIYVVCGPILKKKEEIGNDSNMMIFVPKRFFKVVFYKNGEDYKVIGYVFSQDNKFFCCSLYEIEKMTNLDFFPKIPQYIKRRIYTIEKPSEIDWPGYGLSMTY